MELARIYDVIAKRCTVVQCECAATGRRIRRGHGDRGRDRYVQGQKCERENIFGPADSTASNGDSSHPRAGIKVMCLEYESARGSSGELGGVLLLAET